MKLGRLLLLAGAALAANQFLKTEKGKQMKRNVSDQAGKWKEKLTDMMGRNGGNGHADNIADSNPTRSSYSSGTGGPL